jgi:hypothetical protein
MGKRHVFPPFFPLFFFYDNRDQAISQAISQTAKNQTPSKNTDPEAVFHLLVCVF